MLSSSSTYSQVSYKIKRSPECFRYCYEGDNVAVLESFSKVQHWVDAEQSNPSLWTASRDCRGLFNARAKGAYECVVVETPFEYAEL